MTGRVLVTFDDDYLHLATRTRDFSGIAYCHQDKYTIGELISVLQVLAGVMTVHDMKNHVEYL
jgi:hypothetical protein